jgi:hypothetical protein
MSQFAPEKPKSIVPFDGPTKEADLPDVDRCGDAIISLLEAAAQAARANEERATGVAQKLSAKLKAAEDRATQLEVEVQHYEDRAFRAEKWLLRVYKEIEDKFLKHNTGEIPGRAVVQR